MKGTNLVTTARLTSALLASVFLFTTGCQKDLASQDGDAQLSAAAKAKKTNDHFNENKKIGHFNQVNLTANTSGYGAPTIDATLVNAWGLVFNPNNAVPWIASQGGHVSNVYNSEGVPLGINPVQIPSPGGNAGGNPTGIVFNGKSTDFIIPANGRAAAFIFAGVDGVISAWNGALGKQAALIAVGQGAYTGLALASSGGQQYLYGANFATGRIDVWGSDWMLRNNFAFTDPNLPAGYTPFNIWKVGEKLFVLYAKVDPMTHRSQAGDGLGIVDIFNTDGSFVQRFASGGPLNAPWGVALAPRSFFHNEMEEEEDDDDGGPNQQYILVGNFGNGRINAYRMDGKFVGQLRGQKDPIQIDGLWAIIFPPAVNGVDTNRLYFTAGPDEETHGLFGYLLAKEDD